ncbi:MAG: PIG-L family deacetylase [Sedimentisphaerales bacterium]|nr:PIG-L family deacetylase [Sedimentisphaerales bacterium]
MNNKFVQKRWMLGSLLLSSLLLFTSGTLHASVPKPTPAPESTDGKVRIICFGAHPDDNEFKAGGVASMWAAQGHHVKFVSTTNGDIGHWGMAGGPLAQRRTAEVKRCAEIFGIETEVLDIHDGEIMPTLENRRTIVRLIREWRADIVMCHRPNDYHPDHRYSAILIQDAGYMVTVPYFCPDVPYLKRNPVFLFYQDGFQKPNPFTADIAVGIDSVIEKKLDAALALASQTLEGGCNGDENLYPDDNPSKRKAREKQVRNNFDRRFASTAERFRKELAVWYGQDKARNIKYAEAFEICEYGRRPSKDEIRKLFPFFDNP